MSRFKTIARRTNATSITSRAPLSHPTTTIKRSLQRRNLSYLSSPAKETHWLSQNGPCAKGGAMLAANMSPRIQLVAAEEGLLTWGEACSKLETEAVKKSRIRRPAPAVSEILRAMDQPAPPLAKIYKAKAAERDDTPGLIALSCFLLLPLAFQMGRYFEGKESAWPVAGEAIMPVLEPKKANKGGELAATADGGGTSSEGRWNWSALFWASGVEW